MTVTPRPELVDLGGLKWDAGAPMPKLLVGSHDAVVLCYESLSTGSDEYVMEIRFEGCFSARMGVPNEEVLHGHPLWEHGLRHYEAHIVHNSHLLEHHRRINSVHDYHRDEVWDALNHYFLVFHDEVVEVLARGISARRLDGDMATELAKVAAELAAEA